MKANDEPEKQEPAICGSKATEDSVNSGEHTGEQKPLSCHRGEQQNDSETIAWENL